MWLLFTELLSNSQNKALFSHVICLNLPNAFDYRSLIPAGVLLIKTESGFWTNDGLNGLPFVHKTRIAGEHSIFLKYIYISY